MTNLSGSRRSTCGATMSNSSSRKASDLEARLSNLPGSGRSARGAMHSNAASRSVSDLEARLYNLPFGSGRSPPPMRSSMSNKSSRNNSDLEARLSNLAGVNPTKRVDRLSLSDSVCGGYSRPCLPLPVKIVPIPISRRLRHGGIPSFISRGSLCTAQPPAPATHVRRSASWPLTLIPGGHRRGPEQPVSWPPGQRDQGLLTDPHYSLSL